MIRYALISDALQKMLDGDIISGLLDPFTRVFGDSYAISEQYIYGILFAFMLGAVMLKTQNAMMPAIVFLLIMPVVLFVLPPDAVPIFYVFLILAVTGTIYKIFIHPGG